MALGELTADRRWAVECKLGDALADAGRAAEAAAVYLAVAEASERAQVAPGAIVAMSGAARTPLALRQLAAEGLLCSGHIERGMAVFRSVLATRGLSFPGGPVRAVLLLLWRRLRLRLRGLRFTARPAEDIAPAVLERIDGCWSAATALIGWDSIRAGGFHSLNMLLSLRAGEPRRLQIAVGMERILLAMLGAGPDDHRLRTLEDLSDTLLAEYGSIRDGRGELPFDGLNAIVRAASAFYQGRWQACCDEADTAMDSLGERGEGVAWHLATARTLALAARGFIGDMRGVVRVLPAVLDDIRAKGDLYSEILLYNTVGYRLALMADQPDRAMAELEDCNRRWPEREAGAPYMARLHAELSIALYQGQSWRAYQLIRGHWPRVAGSFMLRVHIHRISVRSVRGRAALAAIRERPEQRLALLRVAARDARNLERLDIPWSRPWAAVVRAGVARARGDDDGALRDLRAAERDFEQCDMFLSRAGVLRRIGELLGGDEGQALIAEADALYLAQGVVCPERYASMLVPPLPEPLNTKKPP
ncbi:MAG: hypothetical protein AAGC55_16135 [Myxococcota bacterium]